ncbi:MAG: glycosyltransferase [Bacteroidetes bacterium]|nr:glycosyltransferase [Bacteroidota bacterium]MCW5895373.1 glycosyltransferase [Bacteroidota bacterium]
MDGSGQPVVVHGIRGYLAPTETFVGNQIATLQTFRPVVLCHHRSDNREFDISPMYVIDENEKGIRKAVGEIAYSGLRKLTHHEVVAATEWIAGFKPALFHFHFGVDAAFFARIYKRAGIPAVVSLYGYDISAFPKMYGGLGRQYLKRTFNTMDCFLAMSEDMKRDAIVQGVPEEKIVVHYHGINVTRFLFEQRTYNRKPTFNILCVGSLEAKKGQHYLIRSFSELRKQRPDIDARLTLVGRGPMLDECTRIVHASGVRDRVHFAGYVPHLDPKLLEYYRNADVFVHFSTKQACGDKEGIPGTIVEAMASGLPVVTTQHAGIPEVIHDWVHGILLNEKDVAGITRSLLALYDDEEMRRKLGREASCRASRELDVQAKTRNLERIYENVVAAARSRKSEKQLSRTAFPIRQSVRR